jgi:uncharacterized repeat protein (TIGR03803 family)
LTTVCETGGTYFFANFTGGGRKPVGLTLSAKGVLFGATSYGGSSGAGTIFSLRPPAAPGEAWIDTNIYIAEGADGIAPLQTPVIGKGGGKGVLYGTTSGGGSPDQGTVFALTPPAARGDPWTKTILYDFAQGDGKTPNSPLILPSKINAATAHKRWNLGDSMVPRVGPGDDGHFHPLLWRA